MKKEISHSVFKRIGYFSLTVFVLLTLFFGYQIQNVTFNYNFEEFYPESDTDTEYFNSFRKTFESDNDFLLIVVERNDGVFDLDFLLEVEKYSKSIEKVDNVNFIRSLINEEETFIYASGTLGTRPYLDLENLDFERDSTRIFKNKELINSLINKKANGLMLFVKHEDMLSKAKSQNLVRDLNAITEKYNFDNVRIVGRTIGQEFYINTMITEMSTYVGLSMILVVAFLIIAFRSSWGLLVPQVVIIGSMVWIVGFMATVNEPLNILLTILPSIMFVVSMSDVIHLVSKYIELLREGKDKFTAIKTSFREIGMATFLTSLTTSIGFFSLIFVNVTPIKSFGIYTGIGVLMAFIITFSTLPFLFYFTKTPKIVRQQKSSFWIPLMRRAFLFTLKNRRWIPLFSVVLIAFFAYGITKIQTNNYIMDDVGENVQIKKDFNYVDNAFGGIRPFELAVELRDSSISFWDIESLKKLEKVEEFLSEEYEVTLNLSLAQSIRVLNRGANAGNEEAFKIPDNKRSIRQFKRILKVANQGTLIDRIMDSTETITRISGTIPDWGNIKSGEKNEAFYSFIKANNLDENFKFKVTGSAHLLDKNMSYMSTSLVTGLSFATLIVALLMGLLFKSLRMVFISMIPNLIPLVFIAGIMGYFGIDLKITTAIVFTISFGIAVDDTIHFLTKYKLELAKGKSKLYALKRTYMDTGKAIVLTSAILCSGFLLLLLSDFMGTFYLGLMIFITLIFAVLGDLFFLPLLLIYLTKKVK